MHFKSNKDDVRKLQTLTWPIYLETFFRLSLGNINVFMISKYSSYAVGGVGVSNQIMNMILVTYNIIGLGSAIVISQLIGAGKKDEANRISSVAICLNLVIGIGVSLIIMITSYPLLRMMNIPPSLIGFANKYLIIVGGISFTQALMNSMSAVIRNYGYTRYPMYIAFGINILNIIGSYISVFKPFGLPEFGVTGVASSLAISQVLGVIAMYYILIKKVGIKIKLEYFKPFPVESIKTLLKTGLPAAGESIAYNSSRIAITYIVAGLGANAITGMTYVLTIVSFVNPFANSIGTGLQIFTGYLVGANEKERAYRLAYNTAVIGAVGNVCISLFLLLMRSFILHIYTSDAAIINLVSNLFFIDVIVEMARALNNIFAGCVRGSGDVSFTMKISFLSMWGISVVLCFIFSRVIGLGLVGIWLAFAIDELIRAVLLITHWKSKKWQSRAIVNLKAI